MPFATGPLGPLLGVVNWIINTQIAWGPGLGTLTLGFPLLPLLPPQAEIEWNQMSVIPDAQMRARTKEGAVSPPRLWGG